MPIVSQKTCTLLRLQKSLTRLQAVVSRMLQEELETIKRLGMEYQDVLAMESNLEINFAKSLAAVYYHADKLGMSQADLNGRWKKWTNKATYNEMRADLQDNFRNREVQ